MQKEDKVNRPNYYRKGKVECIDAIKSALGDGYKHYLQGSVLKYLWRYEHKNSNNPLEDLEKAIEAIRIDTTGNVGIGTGKLGYNNTAVGEANDSMIVLGFVAAS